MTLAAAPSRISYPGTGLVGPFVFPFRVFAYTDLLVTKKLAGGVETTLSYALDFTATGLGDLTGTVTLVNALAQGETISIRRKPPVAQPTSIRNQGSYYPGTIEDMADRLAMIDQSQQDELDRSLKLDESLDPAAFDMRVSTPVAGKVLAGTGSGVDWVTLDSSAVGLPGAGRTVLNQTAYLLNNAVFNAKDYGAIADGNSHPLSGFFGTLAAAQAVYPHATALTQELDWAASQKAINTAVGVHGVAWHPTGTYEFGDTGWTIPQGTQLLGDTGFQFIGGFGINPRATRINFNPLTVKDLFTGAADAVSGFRFHMSVEGFFLKGNSVKGGAVTSRYALRLDAFIYSRFENIGIEGFQTGVYCNATINNKFANMFIGCTVADVVYAGNGETTDVWDQVSFHSPSTGVGCPIGVQFLGSSIAIRFVDCLWEQIDNYGMELAKECQNIVVVNGYCEDVPFTNNANGCMFRVGYTGAALVVENHLTVIGGKWAGRNAGTAGNFLDCDFSNGVMLVAPDVSRFTLVARSTGNTRANSIVFLGAAGISWVTGITNDVTKLAGVYPNGVINSGSNHQNARLGQLDVITGVVTGLLDLSTGNGGQVKFPAAQNPSADVNTLDDYEEGTFTPALKFGGASTGVTYTSQVGSYTKIGRFVFGTITIDLTSKGSSVGAATVTGLPFTASSPGVNAAPQGIGLNLNTAHVPQHYVNNGSAILTLQKGNLASSAALADTDFTNTTRIDISFMYTTT